MPQAITTLEVGTLYSNAEISVALGVGNASGIRPSTVAGRVVRLALMTASEALHPLGENPYRDRLEADVLTYTAAGLSGEQTLAGINKRIIDQKRDGYPIHGFVMVASRRNKTVGPKRWRYLGLLGYRRHYPDTQVDATGQIRKVWLFELSLHPDAVSIPIALDGRVWAEIVNSLPEVVDYEADIVVGPQADSQADFQRIEKLRSKLLSMEPRRFELFLKDLLVHAGFRDVCVTKYSADGGVDVNARVGPGFWVYENALVQIQAKRWLHTVGRKEVAELRGSLQPFARGAVVTTGYFSKAAITEASEPGKQPITLVDGFRLSQIVSDQGFEL